jgi:hypothetical protein
MGFGNDALATHLLYQEGTDAITLVYLSGEQPLNNGGMALLGTDDVPVPNPKGFADGDILYITDCKNYSLFQKTGVTAAVALPDTGKIKHDAGAGINGADSNLNYLYGSTEPLAWVYKLNTATYFIHKDKYTLNLNLASAPLASNIEDLQFEFLFDELNDGSLTNDVWVTNLGAHTAREVRAVRIWVLAMSDTDFTYTDPNTYDYPNSRYYTPTANTYKDAAGNWKPVNPFHSTNGAGGSPTILARTSPSHDKNRHRYLASAVVILRNAGL